MESRARHLYLDLCRMFYPWPASGLLGLRLVLVLVVLPHWILCPSPLLQVFGLALFCLSISLLQTCEAISIPFSSFFPVSLILTNKPPASIANEIFPQSFPPRTRPVFHHERGQEPASHVREQRGREPGGRR